MDKISRSGENITAAAFGIKSGCKGALRKKNKLQGGLVTA